MDHFNPIIRLTTQCTQRCRHCLYSCSPKRNDFMSIETAIHIANFLKGLDIIKGQLFGGEIYLNPDYKEIIEIFCDIFESVRIVTNGDWCEDNIDFLDTIDKYNDKIYLSISMDQYHNKKNYNYISRIMKTSLVSYNIINELQSIYPLGNAKKLPTKYYSKRCSDKYFHSYSFLINEKGEMFKCLGELYKFYDLEIYNMELNGYGRSFKTKMEFVKSFMISNDTSCLHCQNLYKRHLYYINKNNLLYNEYNLYQNFLDSKYLKL